jgi:hypothetical protein
MSRRSWSGLTVLCSCLAVLLLVFASCASSSSVRRITISLPSLASPTSTAVEASPTSTAVVGRQPTPITGLLAPPPTSCPKLPPLQTMTPDNFGGGFSPGVSFLGAAPVWQLGLPQSGGTLDLNAGGAVPLPETKVLWVVGPNYPTVVTLLGRNLSTGAPIWFDIYPNNHTGGSDIYTQAARLDPTNPNRGSTDNSTGHWNIWGLGPIFLAAGCYQLEASWPGGSWRAIYAVGR